MKKKYILLCFIFNNNYLLKASDNKIILAENMIIQEEDEDDFNELVLCDPTLDIVISTQPKKFSLQDIPLYLKIAAIGIYESRIKPAYLAIVAYLKALSLKIKL